MTRLHPAPLGVLVAWLFAPGQAAADDDPDGDHHHPPPEYAAPGWDLPPVSFAEPEYPLAAQFIEADPSNFTAGGIDVVQYVVVHTMQGSYEGSINWFLNPVSDVSAHFCVRSEDGDITQMVHLDDRAWHVGNSNSWAIGIEHEGFVDDASWYTFAMYSRSAELARWLADHFALPLDRDHIVGHVELPNQTHTDPGGNWNWDLYMALVQEIVGEGRVEGVVVDPGLACTLTATSDTYVKATLQDQAELGDDAKCFIAAGTELAYLHAGDDRVGHRRLVLADDGPCATLGEGFAFADHFTGFCAPEELGVAGATVTLDGSAAVVVGADGAFAWTDVGPGAHTIDASATDFEPASLPFDHAGYPGARVVVRLPSPDAASDTTDGGEPPGDGGSTPPPPGVGTSDGSGEFGTDGPAANDEPALPDTYGETGDAAGCGCQAPRRGDPTGWFALLAAPLLLRPRRRRAHADA
jgi:hypothetical protein